jgi:hypothetical protein
MHAMAHSMVRWTFNAANTVSDTWWKDMSIGAQLLCEHYLQSCHHGGSKIYFKHRKVMYVIDLVTMTQQNLSTGKLRQVRRSETTFTPPTGAIHPAGASSEPCHTAEHNFREIEAFRRFDEDDKWVLGVFGDQSKQRKYRR